MPEHDLETFLELDRENKYHLVSSFQRKPELFAPSRLSLSSDIVLHSSARLVGFVGA